MKVLSIQARELRFDHPFAMDVFYMYTYSTAAWLGIQAVPLVMAPKLIVTMLSADTRQPTGVLRARPEAEPRVSD